MFEEETDERLVMVNHRAGYYAFGVTQVLLLLAMSIDRFLLAEGAVDRTLLMFLPWFIGVWTYVILLYRWKYIATVREETARDGAQLRRAWLGALLEGLFFAGAMFAFHRLLPGKHGASPVGADAISAAFAGLLFALFMLWMKAKPLHRYRRNRRSGDDDAE